jgi:hypothetical protein
MIISTHVHPDLRDAMAAQTHDLTGLGPAAPLRLSVIDIVAVRAEE